MNWFSFSTDALSDGGLILIMGAFHANADPTDGTPTTGRSLAE
jgi:hypothetical protein